MSEKSSHLSRISVETEEGEATLGVVDLLHGFVVHSHKQLRLISGCILLRPGKGALAPIGRPWQELLNDEFGWDHQGDPSALPIWAGPKE